MVPPSSSLSYILHLVYRGLGGAIFFKEQVKQIKLISFRVANEDEQRDL